MMSIKRNVSEAKKKMVAGKQLYKCANTPGSDIVENYKCPIWHNGNQGSFDEAGYEIDHITEHSVSYNDNIKNLQALCRSCHSVKTKRFMMRNNTCELLKYDDNNPIFIKNPEIFNQMSEKLDEKGLCCIYTMLGTLKIIENFYITPEKFIVHLIYKWGNMKFTDEQLFDEFKELNMETKFSQNEFIQELLQNKFTIILLLHLRKEKNSNIKHFIDNDRAKNWIYKQYLKEWKNERDKLIKTLTTKKFTHNINSTF